MLSTNTRARCGRTIALRPIHVHGPRVASKSHIDGEVLPSEVAVGGHMFFTDDQCYDGILVSMLPIKAGEDLGSVEHDAVEFVDVEDLIGDLVATDACSGVGHPVKTVTAMATERDRRRSPDDLSS